MVKYSENDYTFIYNGDGKLREVLDVNSNPLIKLKYDPMGNRVYKWSYNAGSPIERNYIVDASAKLATILREITAMTNLGAVISFSK